MWEQPVTYLFLPFLWLRLEMAMSISDPEKRCFKLLSVIDALQSLGEGASRSGALRLAQYEYSKACFDLDLLRSGNPPRSRPHSRGMGPFRSEWAYAYFILSWVGACSASASLRESSASWWFRYAIVVSAAFVPYEIGRRLLNRGRRERQQAADFEAEWVVADVLAGRPTARFSLYLRPFDLTGRIKVKLKRPKLSFISRLPPEAEKSDIELQFEEALRPVAPLVGLGRRGVGLGAGKIETDDATWREKVAMLAKAAKLILIVPGASESVQWELNHLLDNGLLTKTVFFMPPSTGPSSPSIDWTELVRVNAAMGLHLPDREGRACCFLMDVSGRHVRKRVPISEPVSPESLRDAIEDLIVQTV